MSFMYPQFLYAFAVLAIPILLHLFHLRKFKTFYFSNVAFLKELETTSKSARKIKHLLVLLFRLLAFTSLVLAFAQPYFPTNSSTTDNSKPEVRILFIDNSQSLSAKGVEGELFSQAKNMARELVAADRPGGRYLILTNFLSAQELRTMSQPDAIDYIDNLSLASNRRQVAEIITAISTIVNDEQVTGKGIIISDLQKNQWSLHKSVSSDIPLTFVKVTPSNIENISIDSLWTSSPILRPGAQFDLNIKLVNHSHSPINSTSVSVSIDDRNQQFTAEFNENNEALLTVSYSAPKEGFHTISAEIDDQQLFFDDYLHGVIAVEPSMKVGIINGNSSRSLPALVYQLDDYFEVSQYPIDQIQLHETALADLLILNEVQKIDPALRELVASMIEKGKTVTLIPSRQFDVASWNELLTALEMPRLQKIDSTASFLSSIHAKHSFFDGVFESTEPKIQLPVMRNAKLVSDGSRSIPLLSYSDNSVFLAASSMRSNACYLFNSDLNKSNPNLISSDLYSTLLLRIAEMVGNQSSLYHIAGTDGLYSFAQLVSSETPVKIKNDQIEYIPTQRKQNNQTQLIFTGAYDEIALPSGVFNVSHNDSLVGKLAINTNRDESDLTHWDSDEFIQHLQQNGIASAELYEFDEAAQILTLDSTNKGGFWRILLILAIILFVAEMLIIKFWK